MPSTMRLELCGLPVLALNIRSRQTLGVAASRTAGRSVDRWILQLDKEHKIFVLPVDALWRGEE